MASTWEIGPCPIWWRIPILPFCPFEGTPKGRAVMELLPSGPSTPPEILSFPGAGRNHPTSSRYKTDLCMIIDRMPCRRKPGAQRVGGNPFLFRPCSGTPTKRSSRSHCRCRRTKSGDIQRSPSFFSCSLNPPAAPSSASSKKLGLNSTFRHLTRAGRSVFHQPETGPLRTAPPRPWRSQD